jgi:hypothetical protein
MVSAVGFFRAVIRLVNLLPLMTVMLSRLAPPLDVPWRSPGSGCFPRLVKVCLSIFMDLTRVRGSVAPQIFPVVGNTLIIIIIIIIIISLWKELIL